MVIEDALKEYQPHNVGNNELSIFCPFHAEKVRSMFINTSLMIYNCQSCGAGGKLIDLWAEIGLEEDDLPAQQYSFEPLTTLQDIEDSSELVSNCEWGNDYLKYRGVYHAKEAFDIKFVISGLYQGGVVAPIYDEKRNIQGYTIRSAFGGWKKKAKGTPSKGSLFGIHLCGDSSTIVVVEGEYDAMRLYANGICSVAQMNAALLSDDQCERLAGFTVVLLYDGDIAGRKAGRKNAKKLRDYTDVIITRLPGGVDPNTMSEKALDGFKAYINSLED